MYGWDVKTGTAKTILPKTSTLRFGHWAPQSQPPEIVLRNSVNLNLSAWTSLVHLQCLSIYGSSKNKQKFVAANATMSPHLYNKKLRLLHTGIKERTWWTSVQGILDRMSFTIPTNLQSMEVKPAKIPLTDVVHQQTAWRSPICEQHFLGNFSKT